MTFRNLIMTFSSVQVKARVGLIYKIEDLRGRSGGKIYNKLSVRSHGG